MSLDHASLPSIPESPLPVSYEAAAAALRNCERIDECAEWENKAQAMASYARMAGDKTLENLAQRIRARAIRRAAEIWKLLENAQPGPKLVPPRGDELSPKQAAKTAAGLTDKQVETMVAVGAIPAAEFETLVESDTPPTKTALAKLGKAAKAAARPDQPDPETWLKGRTPAQFSAAHYLAGQLDLTARNFDKIDMAALEFADDKQVAEIRAAILIIDRVTDSIMARITK